MPLAFRVDRRGFAPGDEIGVTGRSGERPLPPKHDETERVLAASPLARCDRGRNLFLFPRLREAFLLWLELPTSHLYTVDYAAESVLHRGDMDLVDQMNQSESLDERVALADRYWLAEEEAFFPELIVAGRAVVRTRWGPAAEQNRMLRHDLERSRAGDRLLLSPVSQELLDAFGVVVTVAKGELRIAGGLGVEEWERRRAR